MKTKRNTNSVEDFLNTVENDQKRKDSFVVLRLMKAVTGEEPKIWGKDIIGFGEYHYKYASGREGDWFKIGFSPRKQNITVYTMNYLKGLDDILKRIGKYKRGKSCLYIKNLTDIKIDVLKELIHYTYEQTPGGTGS